MIQLLCGIYVALNVIEFIHISAKELSEITYWDLLLALIFPLGFITLIMKSAYYVLNPIMSKHPFDKN